MFILKANQAVVRRNNIVLLFVANFLYKDRISFDSSVKIRKLSGKVTFLLEVCLNITSNPKLGYIIGFA